MPSVEAEVAAMLKNPTNASAAEIGSVIASAKTFATDAEEAGRAARLRSVDPQCLDGVAERSKAEDNEFVGQRLRNAISALEPHYEAAVKKEKHAKWLVDTAEIRVRIDGLSKELQSTYTECVDKLAALFGRVESINHEAKQFGLGVDGSARIRDVILPVLGSVSDAKPHWPPPAPNVCLEYALSVAAGIVNARPAPTDQERAAEARRVENFYAETERGREALRTRANEIEQRHASGG
jgi:hypothetical protein